MSKKIPCYLVARSSLTLIVLLLIIAIVCHPRHLVAQTGILVVPVNLIKVVMNITKHLIDYTKQINPLTSITVNAALMRDK
mgnify:CR=1 FL=1